ncbi:SDR family oxidoreductase [Curtobacterium sp. 20TX0008]|uniref:SDR family oxidoreductase n=1 Tax=Curtobacterium sp. 20TX0008 TaxID=3022018 RepID=UPI00232F8F75|nr:SDR family NAD(P)-dependent oxidoreductase [Curtobacterium sp. 20TX0008]MDB6425957.1 SDR family oxidoreductase [Curtobacterium sp. 20TX0008]
MQHLDTFTSAPHSVALVIGASRGIGAAVAARFSSLNYTVVGTHRGTGVPAGITGVEVDVTDLEAVTRTVEEVAAAHGRLDTLVFAAGITRDAPLLRMPLEAMEAVLRVNTLAPMVASKAALRPMLRQRSGSIVLLSSMSVKYGVAGQSNYVTSKSAVEGFVRSFAREYGPRHIRINAVAPGGTDTQMVADISDEARKKMIGDTPFGRLASAEEIADAIVSVSELTYMSGSVVPVSGGA